MRDVVYLPLCAVVLVSMYSAHLSAEAKSSKGWKLSQDISGVGKSIVTLTDNAVRMDDTTRGYSIVMSAPKWQPVFFADSRKVKRESSIAEMSRGFSARFRTFSSSLSGATSSWSKVGESKVCGRAVTVYKRIDEKSNWKFYGCKDMHVKDKIATLVCAQYGMADLGQIPLRFETGHNKVRIVFDTTAVTPATIDSAVFEVPKNYKNVKLEEVMFAVMDF